MAHQFLDCNGVNQNPGRGWGPLHDPVTGVDDRPIPADESTTQSDGELAVAIGLDPPDAS